MATSPSAESAMDPKWAAESNLTRLLALTGVFHFLALISVGLRLYVRMGLLRSLGRDDAVIVLAALAALGGWICFILQGYHGFGRHAKTISDEDMMEFTHIGFYGSVVSAIGALGLLKISIAFFLLRLRNNNLWKWYSYCLWALIALVSVYTVGAWLTFFLHCFPMEALWTKNGVCYDPKIFLAVALTNTALNIFTDVCFATLPIPIIWSLQMSRTTRINLIGVLSLGYIAVALGIVKASYQVKSDPDRTFTQYLNIYGFLQLNVGITAASIPTLRPLLKSQRHSLRHIAHIRSPYNDLEQHVETIGSGRKYKAPPRTNFMGGTVKGGGMVVGGKTGATTTTTTTTTMVVDEEIEMKGRETRDVYGGGGDERGVGAQHGSQEHILHADFGDEGRIRCTTEVFVDSVERRGN